MSGIDRVCPAGQYSEISCRTQAASEHSELKTHFTSGYRVIESRHNYFTMMMELSPPRRNDPRMHLLVSKLLIDCISYECESLRDCQKEISHLPTLHLTKHVVIEFWNMMQQRKN